MTQEKAPQTYGQRILFTGPDGIGDYRARLSNFTGYIGIGPSSPEGTSDLNYLCRPAPGNLPPMPKHCYTGEVGWGLQYHQLLNRQTLLSNMQIKRTEFRSALEDRVTQKHQNPCHTLSHFTGKQSVDVRGKPAWTNQYDRHSQDNNKLLTLNRSDLLADETAASAALTSSTQFPENVQMKNGK
ncbi:hypothetical protein DPEC_G00026030 [Dallia pectoralis]|uniref:Uncharacterized protein n=1 Tax=Dallia pectoralis TaxID=75939 RepID=A0ACC2HIH5_DALPE|nr:hypothetical protein DPEC_G00026030 [Dallia pectoralis]